MSYPRCFFSRIVLWASLSLIIAVPATAKDVSPTSFVQTYAFSPPRVETIKIAGEMFDLVEIDECPASGQTGHPALPTKRARILLPYGYRLSNVEVVVGQKELVGAGLRLPPVEEPFVLSTPPDRIPPLCVNEAAYTRSEPLPTSRCRVVSTQLFRGYKVVIINLIPVEYTPAGGVLYYYPEMKLIIKTEESIPTATVRGLAYDAEAVSHRVDNSAELDGYPPAGLPASGAYDLLIISPTDLAGAYQPLKEYHDAHGVLPKSTPWIRLAPLTRTPFVIIFAPSICPAASEWSS